MKRSIAVSSAALSTVAAIALVGLPASAAGPNRASVSGLDSVSLQTSIEGDRFEIAGGKLAQQKGQNAAVKALGGRLVKDHSKSLAEAVHLARRLDIEVPKTPSPSMEWELSIVSTVSGATFDQWYTSLEVQDHKQDIDETKTELAAGLNTQIKKLARTDLPILRKHLALSKAAAKAVGG
jgi:putative membrane protein